MAPEARADRVEAADRVEPWTASIKLTSQAQAGARARAEPRAAQLILGRRWTAERRMPVPPGGAAVPEAAMRGEEERRALEAALASVGVPDRGKTPPPTTASRTRTRKTVERAMTRRTAAIRPERDRIYDAVPLAKLKVASKPIVLSLSPVTTIIASTMPVGAR